MNLIFEPSKTTHWKNLFPNKTLLLGSHNLNDGEELIAKIVEIEISPIKSQNGKDEMVPVARFENAPPMVLNITNCRTIASLYGPNYDDWAGKSIQIFATMVNSFGKQEMALRIREAIPDTAENIDNHIDDLNACKSMDELQKVFMALPKHLKPKLVSVKDQMKEQLSA